MVASSKWLAVVRGSQWTVAKVRGQGKKIKVIRLCETELKGEKDEQKAQLKAWIKKEKIAVKNLRLAVSLPGVVTRIITLPILKPKDLKRLLTEQIDQYFTLNIEDYLVDYRVVDRFEQNDQKMQHILLAALPKSEWSPLWELWSSIGMKPQVVDLAADGLSRFYAFMDEQAQRGSGLHRLKKVKNSIELEAESKTKAESETETETKPNQGSPVSVPSRNLDKKRDLAIIDLNPKRIEIILLEEGTFFLYSDLPFDIQGNQSLSMWNTPLTLPNAFGTTEGQEPMAAETTQQSEASADEWTYEELELAFNPVFRTLGEFFNFFAARHFGKSIDKVFLTGEYASRTRLEEVFRNNLDVEVKIGFPAGWRPKTSRRSKTLKNSWMKYGSLYGLTMRED